MICASAGERFQADEARQIFVILLTTCVTSVFKASILLVAVGGMEMGRGDCFWPRRGPRAVATGGEARRRSRRTRNPWNSFRLSILPRMGQRNRTVIERRVRNYLKRTNRDEQDGHDMQKWYFPPCVHLVHPVYPCSFPVLR